YGRTLLRLGDEKTKPNADRLREYRESNMESLKQSLYSEAPVYEDLETVTLADSLSNWVEVAPNDPLLKAVLNGKSPNERASELVRGTKLKDPAFRKQLGEGLRRERQADPVGHHRGRHVRALRGAQQRAAVRSPEELGGEESGAEGRQDAVQLRLHRRHHRRQLRKPGGEPRQRVRRHRLRRQPAVAAVGLPVRRPAGTRTGRALRGDPRRAAEGLSRRRHRQGSDGEVMIWG